MFGAPPCSLFVGASSSVHQRSQDMLMGNERFFSVRLANRIWVNFVPRMSCRQHMHKLHEMSQLVEFDHVPSDKAEALRVTLSFHPDILISLEQPAQSWGFKIPCMLKIKSLLCLHLRRIYTILYNSLLSLFVFCTT